MLREADVVIDRDRLGYHEMHSEWFEEFAIEGLRKEGGKKNSNNNENRMHEDSADPKDKATYENSADPKDKATYENSADPKENSNNNANRMLEDSADPKENSNNNANRMLEDSADPKDKATHENSANLKETLRANLDVKAKFNVKAYIPDKAPTQSNVVRPEPKLHKFVEAPPVYKAPIKFVEAPPVYKAPIKFVEAPPVYKAPIKFDEAPPVYKAPIKFDEAPLVYNAPIGSASQGRKVQFCEQQGLPVKFSRPTLSVGRSDIPQVAPQTYPVQFPQTVFQAQATPWEFPQTGRQFPSCKDIFFGRM
jgi:hypothetical protein